VLRMLVVIEDHILVDLLETHDAHSRPKNSMA
jgi:hypothetical protein